MAKDYSKEPPISGADRDRQAAKAARFKYRQRFALTIECDSEKDQKALFRQAQTTFKGRKIRVVVA